LLIVVESLRGIAGDDPAIPKQVAQLEQSFDVSCVGGSSVEFDGAAGARANASSLTIEISGSKVARRKSPLSSACIVRKRQVTLVGIGI